MSFASRLWRGLPLLAAVLMTPASNAATACPEPGSTAWKNTFGAAANIRALALSKRLPAGVRTPTSRTRPRGRNAKRTRRCRCPSSRSAEDVADWHADIFERLRGEHFEDGLVRYCGIARSTPVRPL